MGGSFVVCPDPTLEIPCRDGCLRRGADELRLGTSAFVNGLERDDATLLDLLLGVSPQLEAGRLGVFGEDVGNGLGECESPRRS